MQAYLQRKHFTKGFIPNAKSMFENKIQISFYKFYPPILKGIILKTQILFYLMQ
jgi:hypothetical protein